MADVEILASQRVSAPLTYAVPGGQEILLKCLAASFDGSGAAVSWQPAIQIVGPSGQVLRTFPLVNPLAAGASADVSWFRGGGLVAAAPVPVAFASYSGSAAAVGDGILTHFDWVWDATAGQEDMFDLTNPAQPVARQAGIFTFSYTAEFHHAPIADAAFELGLDLNSSLGMSGFAAGRFAAQKVAADGAFSFGNINCGAPLAAGDSVDSSIANYAGAAIDFFGFAYFTRFPLSV